MTTITAAMIDRFACALHAEDRAPATIEKYCRDLRAFAAWLGPQPLAQSQINDWKAHLLAQGYAPVTINARLAALNSFFRLLGWQELHARFLKIQRRVFRDPTRVLTRREYERLLRTARRQGREEQVLLLETLCATGIRVSELSAITVQAVAQGRAVLTLKGKTRVILLPRAAASATFCLYQTPASQQRPRLSRQARPRPHALPDLAHHEAARCCCRCGRQQGLSSQSAPSLCHHVLQPQP